MTGLLFAPIAIGAGLIAGQMSKKLFDLVWSKVSDEEAPRPDQLQIGWPTLVGALVVEGAIFRLAKGLTDRAARKGFARVTGTWPGEERPEAA